MKTKTTVTLLAIFGAIALTACAQDNTPPPGGPRGFHILPPHATEILKLTDDQKTKIAALEAETKTKLEAILTADQLQQLKKLRPPQRPGGPDGQVNGSGAGDNSLPSGPPPGEQ
jgi:hypothetical protein